LVICDDKAAFKRFWWNKIIKILIAVVFTNMGASLGAFAAIPRMVKVLA
jgi:pheromone shutdown protein TraB